MPKIEKCFFKSEWFSETIEVEFEEGKFSAPKNYHEILTKLYNKYLELPPEHERITHGVENIKKENE